MDILRTYQENWWMMTVLVRFLKILQEEQVREKRLHSIWDLFFELPIKEINKDKGSFENISAWSSKKKSRLEIQNFRSNIQWQLKLYE